MQIKSDYLARSSGIIVSATVLCCLVVSFILLYFNISFARKEILSEVSSFSNVLSDTLSTAVLFNDKEYANEIITAAQEHSSLAALCIFDMQLEELTGTSTECSRLSQSRSDMVIRTPIFFNDTNIGHLYSKVNEERISKFQYELLTLSLIACIGSIVIFAVPFAFFTRKIVTSPTVKLARNLQTLSPIEETQKDIIESSNEIIELTRRRLAESRETEFSMKNRVSMLFNNISQSFGAIEKEIASKKDLGLLSKKLASHDEFEAAFAPHLFEAYANTLDDSISALHTRERMVLRQKEFLFEKLSVVDLQEFSKNEFAEFFFENHGSNNNISLEIRKLELMEIISLKNVLKDFYQLFFAFCDYIRAKDSASKIHLSFRRLDHQSDVECIFSLKSDLKSIEPIFQQLELESTTNDEYLEKFHIKDSTETKIKYYIDQMRFYLGLLATTDSNLRLLIDKEKVGINFLLGDLKYWRGE